MINCILLAAGQSQRFGSPKALALLNDQTIIERLLNMLVNTQLSEVVVVLGAHEKSIKPYILNHKKVRPVYNKDHNFGQTSSVQAGLSALNLAETKGVMVLPVDFPLIDSKIIDELIGAFRGSQNKIVIPVVDGKKGHPPVFPNGLFSEIQALDLNCGLNTVIHNHSDELLLHKLENKAVLLNFNTQEEFKKIKDSV